MFRICRIFTPSFNLTNLFIQRINLKLSSTYLKINSKPLTYRFLGVRTQINQPKRNFFYQKLKRPTHEKLRKNDKIPENYELIYRSTIGSYFHAVQIAASISAALLVTIAIVNYDKNNLFLINFNATKLRNILNTKNQMLVFGAGFVLLNIAVMVLIRKIPVRIYFNIESKKYLGVLFGKLPLTKEILEFKVGEVMHSPKNGILPWNEFKYRLGNGRSIILLDQYFRKPDDMNIMLGYTKL